MRNYLVEFPDADDAASRVARSYLRDSRAAVAALVGPPRSGRREPGWRSGSGWSSRACTPARPGPPRGRTRGRRWRSSRRSSRAHPAGVRHKYVVLPDVPEPAPRRRPSERTTRGLLWTDVPMSPWTSRSWEAGSPGRRSPRCWPATATRCSCWSARRATATRSAGSSSAAGAWRRCSRSTWRSRSSTRAGTTSRRAVMYDEVIDPATAEANAAPLDRLLPGVPGCLDIGHPQACEALARAAAEAGATVLRGVGDVEVGRPATPPTLRYELDDLVTTVSAGLVVGADGRTSSVRRQLGLALHETEAPHHGRRHARRRARRRGPPTSCRWAPRATSTTSSSPGRTGRVRLYLLHDIAQRGRFAGPDRQRDVPRRLPASAACPTREDLPRRPPGRPVRVLPDERHLDRRPVRARRRADRRRRGLERPDHRAGPVDRAARRADGGGRRPRRPGPLGRRLRPLRAGAARADAAAAGRGRGPDRPRRHLHPGRGGPPEGVQRGLPRRSRAGRPAHGLAARTGQRARGGVRAGRTSRASSRWADLRCLSAWWGPPSPTPARSAPSAWPARSTPWCSPTATRPPPARCRSPSA